MNTTAGARVRGGPPGFGRRRRHPSPPARTGQARPAAAAAAAVVVVVQAVCALASRSTGRAAQTPPLARQPVPLVIVPSASSGARRPPCVRLNFFRPPRETIKKKTIKKTD